MTVQRDPDAILAAWLEEGPNRLPDATRRAIAVTTRTTHQSRRPMWLPWRYPSDEWNDPIRPRGGGRRGRCRGGPVRPQTRDRSGSRGWSRFAGAIRASPSPSTPAGPVPSVGALTQAFTSPTFGYSIRYPAGWVVISARPDGWTDGWRLRRTSSPRPGAGISARLVPSPSRTESWSMTGSSDPRSSLTIQACMPRRDTQESVTIDGHEGRLMGFCGDPPAPQFEATVVVDERAYLFTLFDARETPNEDEARAVVRSNFVTTITLDPGSAGGSPKPSPS